MSVGHLEGFFAEMSVRVFCPFLIGLFILWVLTLVSSLQILVSSPLSDTTFANIFSHSVGYLLVLLTISLAVSKSFLS